MNDFSIRKTGSDFEVVGPAGHPVDVLKSVLGEDADPVALGEASAICNEVVFFSRFGRYKKFLPIARAYAQMSKDESSKVGALILGPGLEVRSAGWNGAPRGSDADVDQRKERPEKYFWFSHAESNAIANAARAGTPIDGCTMIVTLPPCMDCAKLIVQSGIRTVLYVGADETFKERWKDHLGRAALLFAECGVETEEIRA